MSDWPKYFDIAVKRIKAAYADAGLFTGVTHEVQGVLA